MDISPKISLAMRLPGGTIAITGYKRVEVSLTNLDLHPKDYIGKNAKSSKEANKVVKKFWAKVPVYEQGASQKHLYLLRPAYEWMISSEAPVWYANGLKFKERDWKKMSAEERLYRHMETIAKENGALSFEFEVLED